MKPVCRDCGGDVNSMDVEERTIEWSTNKYPVLQVEPCGHTNGVLFVQETT